MKEAKKQEWKDYSILNEKQNLVLKKYLKKGWQSLSRQEMNHLKNIREKCWEMILKENEAKEILEIVRR